MDQISSNVNMVGPAEGITVWMFGALVTLKVLSNETGGSYSLHEDIVSPGVSPPPHLHTKEDETWYMLDGELEWTVGGKQFHATKGSFIHLPRNVPHSFSNLSDKDARVLTTYAPGGFEQWFLEVGQPVSDLFAPGEPPVVTPDLVRKALTRGKEYGIIFSEHRAKDEL